MNPLVNAMRAAQNPQLGNVRGILGMLKSRNPDELCRSMMQTNPQFRAFVEKNKGKTVEQIANDYGVDLNAVRDLMK